MQFGVDGKGQNYVEWESGPGGLKRAWIQYKNGVNDWAATGRYLNVVRAEDWHTGPKGQATDFPIYFSVEQMPDDQILKSFVFSICAVVGCKI